MVEEKLYSQIKEYFQSKFTKDVLPVVKDWERERIQLLFFSIVLKWTLISAGAIIIIIMLKLLLLPLILIGILFIFIGNIVGKAIKKKFEIKIKRKIMPVICSCFHNLKWIEPKINTNFWEMIISMYSIYGDSNMYETSNLIGRYQRIIDDCFSGEYKGVKFFIEENTSESMIPPQKGYISFNGVFITIDMNKNFNGNTVINQYSYHTAPPANLHRTVLEDVEFEKKFEVFTNDDVEARYLITPSLMERLKSMQVIFKTDKISASFYQNKFFIALSTNKDLFSIGSLTKNICDKEQFFTIYEEILSIIKLIDHFKLDQNIGL